ncbi:short-chain dehydrogenase/reductase [Nocardioides stalactiti]|uniref:short-chain dehydrogenase/reductase n=1 Tax=Nocardioides stalactiti TaxID=2755356 RepID=UPI001602AFFE|nr:short-chain dehydrogenase/reductase [Nocardioides stalactiti]
MFPFSHLPIQHPRLPGTQSYDVRGKVVLVTGAGSGIGEALARTLHDRGACLALLDVDGPAAERVAEQLRERALAIRVDVRDREAMSAAVDEIVAHYGRIDVVVANAGVAPTPATVRTVEPAEFDRVVDINLTGVFNTVRPALPHVVSSHGHVVVVSSAAAFCPGGGLSPYMASKAGVEALGRSLRLELAAVGASAGVAYFGFVRTPMARPLDEDELGPQLTRLMPWPLANRISAEHAAEVIADGIGRRASATYAPVAWQGYSWGRGVLNAVADAVAARSGVVHGLLRAIEGRAQEPTDVLRRVS